MLYYTWVVLQSRVPFWILVFRRVPYRVGDLKRDSNLELSLNPTHFRELPTCHLIPTKIPVRRGSKDYISPKKVKGSYSATGSF